MSGIGREAIEIAQPVRRAAAGGVARERRVDVAVRQHQIAAVQQRQNLPLAAVREIRRVQQRKRGRRQQPPLLPAPRGRFHQRRRIPLRKMNAVAADLEPALQQIELRALPRPVDSLDHHQRAGILALRRGRLFRRHLGQYRDFGSDGSHGAHLSRKANDTSKASTGHENCVTSPASDHCAWRAAARRGPFEAKLASPCGRSSLSSSPGDQHVLG